MRYWLVKAIFVMSLGGCGQESDFENQAVQVYMIHSTESGYKLGPVTIKTLSSLKRVEGEYAVIKGGAVLNVGQEIEEVVGSDNPDAIYEKSGNSVQLDYQVKNQIVFPRNFSSMALLAMYYNFERTFEYWRDNLGLNLSEFGVTTIYNNPVLKASGDGLDIEVKSKVNASFLSGVRDLWFFKKSKLAEIPIKMNWGVMAHEFSHSVFDLLFAQKDPNFYRGHPRAVRVIGAINEGLADYYAYMVTGRVKEFGYSLESMKIWRTIPVFWSQSSVVAVTCKGGIYCYGSLLASALHEVATSSGFDRLKVGKTVFEAIPAFREDWSIHRNKPEFSFHYFLNRIIASAVVEDRSVYCRAFQKWFDLEPVGEGGLDCTL